MPRQLPTDCLNEIFKYLKDKVDLHSCLLTNRLWCEVSVQILWKNIQNYNTLIACLPNESKKLLYKNKIIILTSTSKPPLFNYVTFIKKISINQICDKIINLLENRQSITSEGFDKIALVTQEIFKMLMNQTLKKLNFFEFYKSRHLSNGSRYFSNSSIYFSNIPFTIYPGAIECLRNLSKFKCGSDLSSEFFCQISQICHNLQSLEIMIKDIISDGLTDLLSTQQNLKYLSTNNHSHNNNLAKIIPSITKLPNNLIKLHICKRRWSDLPLTFISKFTNLQELSFSFCDLVGDFKTLQYIEFPRLQILKFNVMYSNDELIKFLEINGKNLKEIYFLSNGKL